MTHHSRTRSLLDVRQLAALLVVAVALLIVLSLIATAGQQQPFASSETQFTDGSQRGLAIVPASCPSSPHYAGECTSSCSGAGCTPEPPTVSGNACIIGLSPSTIVTGGSSFMVWNADYRIFNIPFTLSGTITPTPGVVSSSGVTTVSPTVTTMYRGTFTPTGSTSGIPSSWLVPVTCNATLTVLNSPPPPTACVEQLFCVGSAVYRQATNCTNTLVQTCQYGCSNGACLGAPTPTAFLRLRPALVRPGDRTWVEWSASQVSSCSISGGGDSWTGASGMNQSSAIRSQTTYTLSCAGLDGSTITRSAVVNITPIFNEN